jgi:flagellar biosynthesis chaperone FliJ
MVIIESVIKSNPLGRWYIELSDTMKEESEENRIICLDITEYAQKVEEMGTEYNGEVEVSWSSDEGVSVTQIHEVRQQIMAYEAEIEALENTQQE